MTDLKNVGNGRTVYIVDHR